MYKVLLADDERIIREGITASIDWAQHGLELIGAAKNGIEACEMIEEGKPDIVITDIKMPGLDGLQLINQVKDRYPKILFVILSGYREFELANTAMKFGVKHYLLKPCEEKVIVEVLQDVMAELMRREQEEQFAQRSKYHLEKVLPLVKEQFFRDTIIKRAYTNEESKYYRGLLKIGDDRMRLILLQTEGGCAMEKVFALSNIAGEHMSREQVCLNTALKDKVLLLIRDSSDDEIMEQLKQIQDSFRYYSINLNAFLSDVICFDGIPNAYDDATECLQYSYYLDGGSIFTKRDLDNYSDNKRNAEFNYDFDKLSTAVKCGNIEGANDEVNHFFDMLKAVRCETAVAKTYCMELFFILIRQCTSGDIDTCIPRGHEINRMETIDQMRSFMIELGMELSQGNYHRIENRNNKLVNSIIELINENIGDKELSLKWLANKHLYINASYLGKLFTKATGERFSNYLTRVRMEKAKELIDTCGVEKIYEVAEMVGLGDNPQYFSQVFKANTGYTPTEYSKRRFVQQHI